MDEEGKKRMADKEKGAICSAGIAVQCVYSSMPAWYLYVTYWRTTNSVGKSFEANATRVACNSVIRTVVCMTAILILINLVTKSAPVPPFCILHLSA